MAVPQKQFSFDVTYEALLNIKALMFLLAVPLLLSINNEKNLVGSSVLYTLFFIKTLFAAFIAPYRRAKFVVLF